MPTEIYAVLLGVFMGGFITYYFAAKLATKQQRFIAAANFRATFYTDIAEISSTARFPEIYVYLAQKFLTHDAAVQEFSIHISCIKRKRLAEDWAAYGNSIDDIRQRYSDEAGHPEAKERRRLAVERLRNVAAHGTNP